MTAYYNERDAFKAQVIRVIAGMPPYGVPVIFMREEWDAPICATREEIWAMKFRRV